MPHYVDGFVVPVPLKNLDAYRRMSETCGKIWTEFGALQYWECVGDDVKPMMDPKTMPFDGMRMFWGGFKSFLELSK